MRGRVALLALVLAAPGALALDVFPGEERWGERDARLLVRMPAGGALRVLAEPPVEVAVVAPGAVPTGWNATPAEYNVTARRGEAAWHGLPGTVEVLLRRDASAGEVRVTLMEGDEGTGAEYVWAPAPPAKRTPAPLVLAMGGLLVGATLKRRAAQADAACASR